jgi:hypothetical protein
MRGFVLAAIRAGRESMSQTLGLREKETYGKMPKPEFI